MPAGRPKFEITEKVIKKARKYAAQGLTKRQVAHCLGISHQTLNEKSKEFSALSDAIVEGRDEGIKTVTNALYTKASEGDVPAIKYFLNNRDNDTWKDRREDKVVIIHKFSEMSDEELDNELGQLEEE